jgi:hypothetical protein
MKKIIAALIATAFLLQGPSAFAKDPCKTVLCMAGKLQGKNVVDNCDSAVDDFYDIEVKKKGKFKASKTSDARRDFLNQCPDDKDWQDDIISVFGRARG